MLPAAAGWLYAVPSTPKWLVLAAVLVAGALVLVALRVAAARSLRPVSDDEFLNRCGVEGPASGRALTMRGDIAKALGLPRDRVASDARLRDLMAKTAWFGSDLLALGEIQERFERLAQRAEEVKPEVTVRDLVRIVAEQQGAE
ncbi:MAG TPA: hypothetical protein VLS51_03785 [Propionibacteriaceae bacterium]|nr:hypothetical protein [Propionibacteriaceae bacterium]